MSRRLRRRADRARRRSSTRPAAFPAAPTANAYGEDQLFSLTDTADASDALVDGWARVGQDAAYGVLACRACGGREEFVMWQGPPTLDSLQRSPVLAGTYGKPGPRFAARHAACSAAPPDGSDATAAHPMSRWQVPAALGEDVRRWADLAIADALDEVEADGGGGAWALLGDLVEAGADARTTDTTPTTLVLDVPHIPPGSSRGPAHRRWHATLCDAAAAAGRQVAAVLVVGSATARFHAAAGESNGATTPAVLVVLATATAAYNCVVLDPVGRTAERCVTPWAPIADPSALLDGLFARASAR